MKTVGAFEAKTHLSALLREVEAGAEIGIAKHGKVVAWLVPANALDRKRIDEAAARLKAWRTGRRLGEPVKGLIEEGRR